MKHFNKGVNFFDLSAAVKCSQVVAFQICFFGSLGKASGTVLSFALPIGNNGVSVWGSSGLSSAVRRKRVQLPAFTFYPGPINSSILWKEMRMMREKRDQSDGWNWSSDERSWHPTEKNLCMFLLTEAETTAIIAIYRIFCVSLIIHFTLVTTLFQQQQIRRALKGQLKRWTVCGFN